MNRLRDDAILRDTTEARRLSGLSGAQVFLATKDSRHWFVRKAAVSAAASERLRGQARKQAAFAQKLAPVVMTPKILDEGEVDGRYYFDMEFVRGPDGATYLRRASYDEVTAFAARLSEYLRLAAQCQPLEPGTFSSLFEALFAKLCDVQQRTALVSPESAARLFVALDNVRRLGELPATLCHGDLTLQNMVIGEQGSIWVVDLLDAPFEHYWQDAAKLHQDLAGGWFLLDQPPVAQCVLDFISQRLVETCVALHPEYEQFHALLIASVFVRILPYAPTTEHVKFITDRINYFAARTVVGR